MFTPEEKQFIRNIFLQLSINPANSDAAKTIQIVQEILKKLMIQTKKEQNNQGKLHA